MASAGELREVFERCGAATVGEAGGLPAAARIRPVWPGARVAGPALTVACAPGDNLAVHVAVARAAPGTVLVVEAGAEPGRGYWGEVLTTAALGRRVAGLVIDGGVRDVDALARSRFPVFAPVIALPGATKDRGGTVGGAARVGGVVVASGDWVVADTDGVVFVPAGRAARVAAAARARAEREARLLEELRAGRTTLDLLGLDPSAVTVAEPAD